jgi:hypothetical protein
MLIQDMAGAIARATGGIQHTLFAPFTHAATAEWAGSKHPGWQACNEATYSKWLVFGLAL